MVWTVFAIDDHALVRDAIVQLINLEDDLRVVGEGGGSLSDLDAIERSKPDVVLIDLEMPEVGGTDLIRALADAGVASRVVVCTMHTSCLYLADAVRGGAQGYVLKSSASDVLLHAIRRVAQGEGFIDPALQTDVIKLLQQPETRDLTVLEITSLRLAGEGLSNADIAERTGQSIETVKLHLRRSFQKLGAVDRANAVALALRRRLI